MDDIITYRNESGIQRIAGDRIGLYLADDLNYDEWFDYGQKLHLVTDGLQWWWGDWFNFGDRKFGEMTAQFEDPDSMQYGSLANWKWVASKIPYAMRRESLSYSHHVVVAPDRFSAEEKDYWLGQAVLNDWTVKEMREAIKDLAGDSSPPLLKATLTASEFHTWLQENIDSFQPEDLLSVRIDLVAP